MAAANGVTFRIKRAQAGAKCEKPTKRREDNKTCHQSDASRREGRGREAESELLYVDSPSCYHLSLFSSKEKLWKETETSKRLISACPFLLSDFMHARTLVDVDIHDAPKND